MFMEGEVNWLLVLAITAGVSLLIALASLTYAVTHRVRHVSATGELDMVQKVAEAADKRLFETMNAIPVALVETDRQGKFVFANRAAHTLLGRRDAELIGLRFHSATWGITFPDGRPIPPDLLPSARALRGQTVKGFQHLLANPATRKKMLVSVTAMPIEDETGTVIGSIAAIVETESLATPAAAEVEPVAPTPAPAPSSDLTRRVFEAASSALVVLDIEGRVQEANAVARRLVSSDSSGADFADLFLAEDERVLARQALKAAGSAPAGEAEPITARGRDGSPLTWRILPLADDAGGPTALLLAGERAAEPSVETVETPKASLPASPPSASVDDETLAALRERAETAEWELTEAHAALERARDQAREEGEAARRLETVSRMTGGVAQDFHALLAVMTSALDMMAKQADDPGRVRRLAQAALTAGQKGEDLTRRLAALSEGDETGRHVLDAGVLLKGMEGRLRALAGPGVDLMIEGPARPAEARIDPVAFDGAVEALTRNAVEAVGGQGSVAVRLETLDGALRLSVRDNGPGFDAESAGHAVEPFFSTRPGSAGLGLAQAEAFARQSGGEFSIDSRPGEGAEVSIILPLAA